MMVMMDLNSGQWLKHAVVHPFEGFEDMRWKKAGSVKISLLILFLWFAASIFESRLYGFQFYTAQPDKVFNVIPHIVRTFVLFLTWVTGNRAVCTFLEGEGTARSIFIYSAYALVPYVTSLYTDVLLSHFLIRDEVIFMQIIRTVGYVWSALLVFSAVKAVHQYTVFRTLAAIVLTIVSMFVILFLLVLLLSLFQQIYVFGYSVFMEIAYRLQGTM